jgi:hypothetical protein
MTEYIKREAAIEAATDAADEWDGGYNPHRAAQIREGIKYIPAADVVPVRHGRWREVERGENGVLCECSVCKEWLLFYYGFVANYCPVCGAIMDLVTECNQVQVKDGDGE